MPARLAFVHVIGVDPVNVAVVRVIGVIAVRERDVAAALTVGVLVAGVRCMNGIWHGSGSLFLRSGGSDVFTLIHSNMRMQASDE